MDARLSETDWSSVVGFTRTSSALSTRLSQKLSPPSAGFFYLRLRGYRGDLPDVSDPVSRTACLFRGLLIPDVSPGPAI